MHLTLIMVTSADGKTTHATNTHRWASKEDQAHFQLIKKEYPVIIMGRKTYDAAKHNLILSDKNLRIIMTKEPNTFIKEQVSGQLEFTDESPGKLIERLMKLGHQSALLVGGSNLNDAFLQAKLITDCYITIEPKFFGSGNDIFSSSAIDVSLRLTSLKQLNEQGSILLHYTIHYDR